MIDVNKKQLIFSLLIAIFGCSGEQKNQITNSNEISYLTRWSEVWSDEFDTPELDLSSWNKLEWRPGWVNNELQAYTDRDTNIFIENGHLILQALIEPGYLDTDYTGAEYNADYTSGRINTDNKISRTYGRFDVRAKLPKGNGSWPAIWMLGESISEIGWPACGEIDIMEHVGYDNGMVHGSIHTDAYNHMNNTQKSGSRFVDSATDSFHVYSLEWTPNYLRYLIDNSPYFFVYNDSDGDVSKWPFDQQHYLILNLAIGGDWGGVQGVDPSAFPMRMYVDYVKIFKQKDEGSNDVRVTFQVDMKNENISGTGVWLSGGNISSGQPGGLQMQVQENSDVWQTTLILPPNSEFTYKFRNGYQPNSWSGGWETPGVDCTIGQHNDRYLTVGLNDTTLTAVCFSECVLCD